MTKYIKTHTTKNYVRKRIEDPKNFAPGSFRLKTLTDRKRKLVVACPVGHWNKKTQRCKVGLRAQALLVPKGHWSLAKK